MLPNQKHLFQLPADIRYLNCAYISPLPIAVEEAGIRGMIRKRNPALIRPEHYFNDAEVVRQHLGKLINAAPRQIALTPSASYGLKAVVNNLPLTNGNHAITISAEFPSGYYTISNWCQQNNKELRVVGPPKEFTDRGKKWNERILDAINKDTAVVVMSSIHWADGTKFDLQEIGKRCKEADTLFIVDGTQSVGALPMDVNAFQIDALVCAAYKWMLAPYSMGFAYMSEYFNGGDPLEDTWMTRANAQNFSQLSFYVDEYRPGAGRYDAGEFSNFILLPMFTKALELILTWKVPLIQEYCADLVVPLIQVLQDRDFWIENGDWRTDHLFGFLLPDGVNTNDVMEKLQNNGIFVSLRGDSIRVSPHVYNTREDMEALADVIKTLR